jgi:foldase protein PrsA
MSTSTTRRISMTGPVLGAVCGGVMMLGAAGLAGVAASGCGGSGDVVVRVGGETLSMAELNHWMSVDAAVRGESAGSTAPLKRQVLGFLISARWLMGEARELGVRVSEGEATKQLELLRFDQIESRPSQGLSHYAELRRLLLSKAVGSADRLWLMRLSMLTAQVEARYLSQAAREVPRAWAARYYAQHKPRYFQPQWRDLEILTSGDRALVVRAKREIEAGKPFLDVARAMPEPDVEAPGGLQHLVAGAEEREFEEVIFAAKPHVLTGPAKLQFYYLFEVLDGRPAHQQTLAEAEGQIRRQLAPRQALATLLPSFEAKWIARTDCRPGYVVQGCRQYRGPKAAEEPLMFG